MGPWTINAIVQPAVLAPGRRSWSPLAIQHAWLTDLGMATGRMRRTDPSSILNSIRFTSTSSFRDSVPPRYHRNST